MANGVPGIEMRLPILFSEGVLKKRLTINQFVALCATNHARMYGLYPRKGTIAVGSDADLIVFDPKREETISAKTHHMRVDYSMFEGIRTKGSPKLTMSRGRVIIENGKFTGRPGAGSFLRRKTYAAV